MSCRDGSVFWRVSSIIRWSGFWWGSSCTCNFTCTCKSVHACLLAWGLKCIKRRHISHLYEYFFLFLPQVLSFSETERLRTQIQQSPRLPQYLLKVETNPVSVWTVNDRGGRCVIWWRNLSFSNISHSISQILWSWKQQQKKNVEKTCSRFAHHLQKVPSLHFCGLSFTWLLSQLVWKVFCNVFLGLNVNGART